MRIDALEELLAELDREGRRPKFIYSVPTFQNPGGVTLVARAAAAARRDRARARAPHRRGQPLRAAPLRGRAAADALLARRRRLRPLRRDVLEDPLPRDPDRLGLRAAAGARQARARQAGRRPLHLDAEPVLRPRVLRRGTLARLRRASCPRVYRAPPRRDARALATLLPATGDLVAARGRAVRLGDPARLHRHHRPAGQGAARERRLRPRRGGVRRRSRQRLDAAQLLGPDRGRDPRGHPPDRRRDRRAGRASTRR